MRRGNSDPSDTIRKASSPVDDSTVATLSPAGTSRLESPDGLPPVFYSIAMPPGPRLESSL